MRNSLRLKIGRYFLPLPAALWRRLIERAADRIRTAGRRLGSEHRAVQHYAVREIARFPEPLPPAAIAAGTGIAEADVVAILAELEKRMTYLWRDPQGRVTWAYPVTAESTPHHMAFTSGERLDAA